MEQKLRLGVIGLGRGRTLARNAVEFHGVEFAAACDKGEVARTWFKKKWGEYFPGGALPPIYESIDDMLERAELDVVFVATPPPMHVEHSIRMLEAGLHVLSEVPAAFSIEQAKELVAVVRKSKGIYFFGENACYSLTAKAWRRFVEEGRIGEPQYVEGEYIHDLSPMMNRYGSFTWRATELDPIRYCTHETGPILDILDDRIVQAVGMGTSSKVVDGKAVDDIQVALFKTSKGVTFKELTAFAVKRPLELHYYSLFGSKGMLETTRVPSDETLHTLAHFADMPESDTLVKLDLGEYIDTAVPGGGRTRRGSIEWDMLRDFFSCIREQKPPTIDVYRGLDYTLPGIVAAESIQQGSVPLPVPDPREW